MKRREFLKSIAAVGASVSLPLDMLASAPDSVIERAWNEALSNPTIFYVSSWGTLSYGVEETWQQSREQLFGWAPVHNRQALQALAYESGQFAAFLENAWIKREDEDGEETVHDDWQSWLNDLSGEAVDELIECANGWLEEDADETDWEIATLRGYTEQGAALTYFRDDFPCSDLFNIVIVEGDHPGSTYSAAELRMSVEDANLIAEAEGLPIRFEWSGD